MITSTAKLINMIAKLSTGSINLNQEKYLPL